MSDGNVEQLERGYTVMWREGRPEDAVSALGPDFEWVVPDHPEGEVRHGAEGVVEFVHEWIEPWEDLQVDWKLEPGTEERVMATIEMSGRGRDSGVPTEMSFWQVWTFNDGRAVRMEVFWEEDAARAAAGLA